MLPAEPELVPLKPKEPKVDGRHTGDQPAVVFGGWMCWDREVCVLVFFFGGEEGGILNFRDEEQKEAKLLETQVFDCKL